MILFFFFVIIYFARIFPLVPGDISSFLNQYSLLM